MSELFDPGLQPERTELAWRRTCLTLGVGSLIAMRVLPAALGSAWWLLAGATSLAASAGLWVWARHRYRAASMSLLRDGDRVSMPGAGLLFALTVLTAGIALTSLGLIVVVAIRPVAA